MNKVDRHKVVATVTGFTLLELLIAIAMVSILASLAVPAFNRTVSNAQLTSNVNLFVGAVNYARSEAIERQTNVSMEVAAGASSWQVVQVAPREVLKTFEVKQNELAIELNGLTQLTYLPSGYRVFAGAAVEAIEFCNDQTSSGRQVNISISGSPSVTNLGGC